MILYGIYIFKEIILLSTVRKLRNKCSVILSKQKMLIASRLQTIEMVGFMPFGDHQRMKSSLCARKSKVLYSPTVSRAEPVFRHFKILFLSHPQK